MTRPRGIGRGRGEGSKATQFSRGGKRQEQPRRRKGKAERDASGAAPPPRDAHKHGIGGAPGTPRAAAAGSSIAWEDLLARAELAERGLAGLGSELAEADRSLARAGLEWSLALRALESHPAAREAVLDAVFGPGGAGRAAPGVSVGPPVTPTPAASGAPGTEGTGGSAGGRPAKSPALPEGEPADRDRPKGVREQMKELGIEHGRGGLQQGRRGRLWSDRDEPLDPGSPGERGRGRWGDEPPF